MDAGPLTNNRQTKVTLTGLAINWTQANGKLMKVKFYGDVIYDVDRSWAAGGITLSSAELTTDINKKRHLPR